MESGNILQHLREEGLGLKLVNGTILLGPRTLVTSYTSDLVKKHKFELITLLRKEGQQKDKLRELIKKVSNSYGGDDEDFLNEVTEEIIKANEMDLNLAIKCFTDLANERPYDPRRTT